LGFKYLDPKPVTLNAERAMSAVPPVLIGVATAMAGLYWLIRRRDRMSQTQAADEEKNPLTKKRVK